MSQSLSEEIMYKAVTERDRKFEGIFVVAVKTTGIFCRPGCTARTPKRENVEFFKTAKEAIAHGYRPCKVCKPLQQVGEAPSVIISLLKEMDVNPMHKITDGALRERGLEPNSIRRWFQKNYGLTFHAFQRQIRINNAFQNIKRGNRVIDTAFENGYESLSGFNYSYKKTINSSPRESRDQPSLVFTRFSTPLGPMMAIAAEEGICLVEFTDRKMLETELKQIQKHFKTPVLAGKSPYFEKLESELEEYFAGKRKKFTVPLVAPGTVFQKEVWEMLQKIPYGKTISYKQMAQRIKNDKAVRAVARANGANRIAILIPCHRVIGDNGHLTGYGGGLWRKKWLLELEREIDGAN